MNFLAKLENYITSSQLKKKIKTVDDIDDIKEKAGIIYTDPFPEDPTRLTRKNFGNIEVLDLEFLNNRLNEPMGYEDIIEIQSVNQTIISNLDFNSIAQKIVDKIRSDLGFIVGCLFILDSKKGIGYSYTITGELVGGLELIFGKKTIEHIGEIYKQDNLVVRSFLTKKAYIGNDFRDFVSPVLSNNKANIVQVLLRTKTNILVPLIINNNVIGAIMFVGKQKILTDREKVILKIFSDQMAIALHNAMLYKEIQAQVIRYQEKTQDLESLLSLSSMSSLGMEVEKSVQNIMDILPVKLGHLGILGAILTRYDKKDEKVYAYITTESPLTQKAKKLLPKSLLTDYYVLANKTDPLKYSLTSKSIFNNEITKSDNLVDFISPPVDARTAWLIKKTLRAKATIAVPINIRGVKLGALIYIFNKPLADVGGRDLDLVTAFTQHVGVVLENLQFYESLNENIEELTKTKNNLEEAISMKNDFLHIVSHQLRTPLTAVRGFVYMWRDGDFDNLASGKLKEVRTRVADNIDRLNNIVNDMIIAMESEGSMKLIFTPVDVEKLLKDNIEMLKSSFEKKGLYIKYQKMNREIPLIEADAKYLRHVFMNLIDNAVKYTEKGGLEIMVRREKENIYVRFIDTGVGISDGDKALLFKKFSRGKNSSHINPGGSGLGLFISKQILDEHHGKLQYSSMGEGKGATFVVELPVRQPASPSLGGPASAQSSSGEKAN